jgi:dihydrodipicolinate synthase/N-acetylneuraminate lyase
VPGLANVAPALLVALRAACGRGDLAGCRRDQEAVQDLGALYTQGHWLPALKAACALLGLGSDVPSPPFVPAGDAERRAIAALLGRHGLLPGPDRATAQVLRA